MTWVTVSLNVGFKWLRQLPISGRTHLKQTCTVNSRGRGKPGTNHFITTFTPPSTPSHFSDSSSHSCLSSLSSTFPFSFFKSSPPDPSCPWALPLWLDPDVPLSSSCRLNIPQLETAHTWTHTQTHSHTHMILTTPSPPPFPLFLKSNSWSRKSRFFFFFFTAAQWNPKSLRLTRLHNIPLCRKTGGGKSQWKKKREYEMTRWLKNAAIILGRCKIWKQFTNSFPKELGHCIMWKKQMMAIGNPFYLSTVESITKIFNGSTSIMYLYFGKYPQLKELDAFNIFQNSWDMGQKWTVLQNAKNSHGSFLSWVSCTVTGDTIMTSYKRSSPERLMQWWFKILHFV